MEDQGFIPFSDADDGGDTSAIGEGSSGVCEEKVRSSFDPAPWKRGPEVNLDPDTRYEIWGAALNMMHRLAIDEFNQLEPNDSTTLTRGFWNGYSSAVEIIRSIAQHYPVYERTPDSEVS